jgi:hypothetical protein
MAAQKYLYLGAAKYFYLIIFYIDKIALNGGYQVFVPLWVP